MFAHEKTDTGIYIKWLEIKPTSRTRTRQGSLLHKLINIMLSTHQHVQSYLCFILTKQLISRSYNKNGSVLIPNSASRLYREMKVSSRTITRQRSLLRKLINIMPTLGFCKLILSWRFQSYLRFILTKYLIPRCYNKNWNNLFPKSGVRLYRVMRT